MAKVSTIEAIIIGIIVGISCPKSLGGIESWRFWAYLILMNLLLSSMWAVIKAWRQRAADRKFKKSLD